MDSVGTTLIEIDRSYIEESKLRYVVSYDENIIVFEVSNKYTYLPMKANET